MPTIKDPSDVTCLVYDNGLFLEQALKLAETYKKVYYHVPWESAFPKMQTGLIGHGYPNIELVDSPFGKHFKEIDLFHFPDLNSGPIQQHLVDEGKIVWGCRLGECMELDRVGMKEILKELDLPVGKFATVKGVSNLRAYLKDHDNVYVKIGKWRGSFETFYSPDYKHVEPKIDEIEFNLGPLKHVVEFVVEDALDEPGMFEGGTDGWVIDGEYPSKCITGIEVKDKAYVAKFLDYLDIPEPIRRFNDRMKPVFEAYGYRGFFSSEVRIGKDRLPHMIDACTRSGSPPNELYQNLFSNMADCIWYGANGIVIDPVPAAKFGAEIMMHSSWAEYGNQPIYIEPDVRQFVKLRNSVLHDGIDYILPQPVPLPEIGAVIGLSDVSIEDAIENAIKNSKGVSGYYLEIPTSATDEAMEQVAKMEKLGLNYFKDGND